MKSLLLSLIVFTLLGVLGCSSEITVTQVGAAGRIDYGESISPEKIAQSTHNLLGNFFLEEDFEKHPDELIVKLENLFRNEPQPSYLAALADCSLNIGLRFGRSDPDTAVRYFLSAGLYSYGYLAALDRPDLLPYNAERLLMMRIYNLATSEIFGYLHKRGLHLKSSFTLSAAGNQRVNFLPPQYELPLSPENFADFLLCADFRTENLTHISRSFGIGAPLICELTDAAIKGKNKNLNRFAQQQTLPGTLMIKFNLLEKGKLDAQFLFLDSRNNDSVPLGKFTLPIEQDFSTPLAYMVRNPLPFDYLTYMLQPEETRQMQGLYMFEPFREDRIPVVLVHGLLSNIRTWMQLINTLQSDPVLRKHYQFWGFTYSSGNPVLLSAKMLRDDLTDEEGKLKQSGVSTTMFSRMVLVGHSMGGLVSELTVKSSGDRLIEPLFGHDYQKILNTLEPEQKNFVEKMMHFEPLPFVKRLVFLAVPHRGSEMAQSWIARLGSYFVKLPIALVTQGEGVIKSLMDRGVFMPNDTKFATGIDNLDPGNRMLNILNTIPFAPGVVYHSIIGNRREDGVPGGSDGVVPYLSSHLDGAASELVVKSGHSVQVNPLAIQELRRILIEHLRQFPELKVELPEFPDKVGNAKTNKL
ncbi:MAG: hypothetical protein LBM70_03285 [Victivallales bacterium]|jgi:pimeloyl-ACP methyl ester carboxylesterase|nr:hypothetical protein [Victivallales bacterium]